MPEGDTIFRAARTLNLAFSGRTVTRFESVLPKLTRVDDDAPLRGRVVEKVTAQGKHLLFWFSGDLVLRTHMRMHGSWHIYRPGERWKRPGHDMRILISSEAFDAVGFNIPIAEFLRASELGRSEVLRELGPDLLAADFDAGQAVQRIAARRDADIADALLDQRALAGIGNVFKSETLFMTRVNPFTPVAQLTSAEIETIVQMALRLLRANVGQTAGDGIVTYGGLRRTTGRADPAARLWVYGRAGQPCRRCGTPVSRQKQGPHARSTYWCEKCQPSAAARAEAPALREKD